MFKFLDAPSDQDDSVRTSLLKDEEHTNGNGDYNEGEEESRNLSFPRRRADLTAWLFLRSKHVLIFLLPSFVIAEYFPSRAAPPDTKVHKTAYLDGLRGVAAVAVVIFHYTNGVYPGVAAAWGARGNDGIMAYPIIRLIYSGPFAVSLFFVISGFALSIKPVEYMLAESDSSKKLFRSMSSATLRRPIRLYLPAFASTIAVFLVLASGIMDRTGLWAAGKIVKTPYDRSPLDKRDEDGKAAPAEEFANLFMIWLKGCFAMFHVFNNTLPTESQGHPFNRPLWSIVTEFRASILLFVLHLGVANVRRNLRMHLTLMLMVFSSWMGNWEMVLFVGGFLLALIDPLMPHFEDKWLRTTSAMSAWKGSMVFILLCGLFLGSYPDYLGPEAPGYMILTDMIPSSYPLNEKPRFWQGIGGLLIVFAVGRLPWMMALFASKPLRYVGQISFSLYLIHSLILASWGIANLYWIWQITGRESETWEKAGFALSVALVLPVAFWFADVFWRAIDLPSVKLARWVESKVVEPS